MHEDDDQGSDSETETEKGSDRDDDRIIANQEIPEATQGLFSQTSQDAEFDEEARLEQEIQDHEIGTRKDSSSRMGLPSR